MQTNLVGEMTVLKVKEKTKRSMVGLPGVEAPGGTEITDFDLIEAVASALELSSTDEREGLEKALFPAMLCASAATGSLARMKALKDIGADVSASDYDRRTPLHVAAAEGNLKMVRYLMEVTNNFDIYLNYSLTFQLISLLSLEEDHVNVTVSSLGLCLNWKGCVRHYSSITSFSIRVHGKHFGCLSSLVVYLFLHLLSHSQFLERSWRSRERSEQQNPADVRHRVRPQGRHQGPR